MGYRESGLIVPWHPANPRGVAGMAVGLHSESPGIGAEPDRVPGLAGNCRVRDYMSVQGWTVFPTFWIVGGQTCWTDQ